MNPTPDMPLTPALNLNYDFLDLSTFFEDNNTTSAIFELRRIRSLNGDTTQETTVQGLIKMNMP